jgi:ribosomal subunit interface protein
MIQLQVTGKNYEVDEKVSEYIDRKLAALDKYLPRQIDEVKGRVILEQDNNERTDSQFRCEVQIDVKGEQMYAKEATINMYAAIDICEQKLKGQILRYKQKHLPAKNRRRRLFAKLLGRDPLPPTE